MLMLVRCWCWSRSRSRFRKPGDSFSEHTHLPEDQIWGRSLFLVYKNTDFCPCIVIFLSKSCRVLFEICANLSLECLCAEFLSQKRVKVWPGPLVWKYHWWFWLTLLALGVESWKVNSVRCCLALWYENITDDFGWLTGKLLTRGEWVSSLPDFWSTKSLNLAQIW